MKTLRFITFLMLVGTICTLTGGCSDDSGQSTPATNSAQSTLATPATPALSPGNAQLTVSWSAVPDATSYEVWYNTNNDCNSAVKCTTDINAADTTATITGLLNSTTYYVWIRAVNSAGTSNFSSAANTVTLASTVTLQYDNNIHDNATGSDLIPFEAMLHVPAATMNSYLGYKITSVSVYIKTKPPTGSSLTLKIYTGSANPDILAPIYAQPIDVATITDDSWNTVTLTTPQTIANDTYWIGFRSDNPSQIGINGLQYNPDGNRIYLASAGGWTTFYGAWNIHVILTAP